MILLKNIVIPPNFHKYSYEEIIFLYKIFMPKIILIRN